MTEPSQYFKGRTVQEQMNEVIGYVDARAEEVAAAKADDVLQPAEDAKTAAQAAQAAAEDAQDAAEAARDTTLAALPQIQSDISALDGRLDTVELKVTTAEGNIVTIQGQITALQTADGQNVKLTGEHAIGNYALLLTDNQDFYGNKTCHGLLKLTDNQQYSSKLRLCNESMDRGDYGTLRRETQIVYTDTAELPLGMIMFVRLPNGTSSFVARIFDKNGIYHDTVVATYADTL